MSEPVWAPPFFPRTEGRPLVSVLMPTRGRPGPLRAAVDSVVSLAEDKGCMEFLFRADEDDHETVKTIEDMKRLCPAIPMDVRVGPRGNGYHDIHLWDNELASRAKGDWLFVMNDDAVIRTQDWDRMVQQAIVEKPWPGIQDVAFMVFETLGRPFAQEFFLLRRRAYEVMGHMFLSPHGDNWLYTICHFLGVHIHMPVQLDHFSGVIEDKTRDESVEAYRTTIRTLISTPAKWDKLKDATALLVHMSKAESQMAWYTGPAAGPGWYFWRKDADGVWLTALARPDGLGTTWEDKNILSRPFAEMGGLWSKI